MVQTVSRGVWAKRLLGGFGRCPPPVALPVQIISVCEYFYGCFCIFLHISFYLDLPSSKELLGGFCSCPPPVALPVQIISAYEITLVVFAFLYFVFAVFEWVIRRIWQLPSSCCLHCTNAVFVCTWLLKHLCGLSKVFVAILVQYLWDWKVRILSTNICWWEGFFDRTFRLKVFGFSAGKFTPRHTRGQRRQGTDIKSFFLSIKKAFYLSYHDWSPKTHTFLNGASL